MLMYNTVDELISQAQRRGVSIGELVIEDQALVLECSRDCIYADMRKRLDIMRECTHAESMEHLKSTSGLTGGDAYRMYCNVHSERTVTGPVLAGAIMRALAVSETNAGMGRIVAAPTAGSCGILPAALLTLLDLQMISEQQCITAMFTAGAIGMVISNNATVAGAQGGCQAECGSAAAMAAGAVTEAMGGSPSQVGHAAAIALKNILGLVCDPVAGLVEIPCIKRNAAGVANALTASEMALAHIESKIPVDEVIVAMKQVGDTMSRTLKETAEGGLAVTPTGKKLFEQVFGKTDKAKTGNHCRTCSGCHS